MVMASTHYHLQLLNPSLRLVQTSKLTNPNNSIRVQQPFSVSVKPLVSVFHRRSFAATVSLSLPISNPELVSSPGQEIPKWSSKAIKSFAMATLEARKLKFVNTGTEALILGVLVEGTNLASKFLRANGITIFKVRDEIVKVLGVADMYTVTAEQPPVNDEAQRVLDWAVDKKLKSAESGEITTAHIILGIWSEVDSPGHTILSNLGFNEEKAKELESLISKSVIDE